MLFLIIALGKDSDIRMPKVHSYYAKKVQTTPRFYSLYRVTIDCDEGSAVQTVLYLLFLAI
jgi:hypothetical protein